ncbi:Pentatricopeptide repeat-containing protein [Apostasia shenzhenica]|uniref:Pentatricopeptide repeat-containing protein n=1 Tax=Apostasia shenzhenica TaxID=1088818 RepID=A0A2I0ANR7_9ASPA|nr:Pentatricopeptide repeat-containing protein [Apostasia shenzhenica]
MFPSLRLIGRRSKVYLICPFSSAAAAAAAGVDLSSSWLSSPGNPVLPWPPLPSQPPNPPSKTHGVLLQLAAAEPVRTVPLSHRLGQDLSDATDESVAATAAAVSSLVSSTPISDLSATLRRSDLLPRLTPSHLSSVVEHLARSKSFDLAWSVILSHPPVPLSAFASLFRRYCRAKMPSAAIRTLIFLRRHVHILSSSDNNGDPLELLLDALCKEGYSQIATDFLTKLKSDEPTWLPSARCYNILLHGWFRRKKLRKAERLWEEMRSAGVHPTVVSYGTVIEGLCSMSRPDQAMALFEEMRAASIDPNLLTCNPIVDSLSEAGRFRDAMGFVERFPLFGVSPNISTYNSLVKGFCKNGDLKGASKVLKTMIGRRVLPTAKTYNYFFRFFSKFGKIEEGMNLYTKMIQSGHNPDRLTYQLLIKMLCEKERLDLAVQLLKEMNKNGLELDLAMSTMLIHMLCRLRRYEEACNEFEEMFNRGIVPQYITYRKLLKELERLGLSKMVERLSTLMYSVPHSTKLPATYKERERNGAERRKLIMKKAQAMSELLKVCKDKDEMCKLKSSEGSMLERANELMTNIRRRVYAVKVHNV